MKKTILSLFAFALAASTFAPLTAGAKVGLNYTTWSIKYETDPQEKPDNPSGIGFHLGGYLQFDLSDQFAFRPELLFSVRGMKQSSTTTSTTTVFGITTTTKSDYDDKGSYSYLEVPLLMAWKASDMLAIHFGPGIGLLMGAKYTSDISTSTTVGGSTTSSSSTVEVSGSDAKEGMRGSEIGLCVGGAYETEGGLNFGLRYWRGLTTVNDDTEFVKVNTNLIQVSVGYSFLKP